MGRTTGDRSDQAQIDDACLIIGLLGRDLLGWGAVAPDQTQFAIFYRPDGDGYVEQCPWSLMGLVPPETGPDPDHMRYFTEPVFSEEGAVADVKFVTTIVNRDSEGQERDLHINQQDLTLRKGDGSWRIISRRKGPTT